LPEDFRWRRSAETPLRRPVAQEQINHLFFVVGEAVLNFSATVGSLILRNGVSGDRRTFAGEF